MTTDSNIIEERKTIKKKVLLKDTRDAPLSASVRRKLGNGFFIENDLPLIWPQVTADQVEGGGLARSIGADEAKDLATADIQVEFHDSG
jgi:hypothetical protein